MSAQLIAVLGSGGVGKTTTSAAIALALAKSGKRAAVITVDPAHRLAQVLGLEGLSNEARELMSFPNGGKLSALWLDTSNALEELVSRHAGRAPSLEKVTRHRLFKIMQSQLGGVEEYLGVERVLSLRKSGNFDVLILDTPPSRHALDFLESPRHILKFFDESILKVFLDQDPQAEAPGGIFAKVFRSGRNQMLDLFRNFLGASFLGELAELLQNLKPVHAVFTDTARGIEDWVKESTTRFALVSIYEPYPLDEARLLRRELDTRGLPAAQLMVLNKCLPTQPPPVGALTQAFGGEAADSVVRMVELQEKLRSKLMNDLPSDTRIAEVPRYSVRQLSREQLMEIGDGILQKWSKNGEI